MVVDPSLEEEATAAGLMTVIMNAFGELCAVQKTSGIGLPTSEVCPAPCFALSTMVLAANAPCALFVAVCDPTRPVCILSTGSRSMQRIPSFPWR